MASADLVIRSYDFATIEALQRTGDWDAADALLAADARMLEAAGAEIIALCTNTMHLVAPAIEAAVSVPFVHIGDATAAAVTDAGLATVALLGTRFTMEEHFHRARLEAHGLTVMVPDEPDRTVVHDVIYDELVQGVVSPSSKARYLEIIGHLVAAGATGVIAGCTEIELLVGPDDVSVSYFPTTRIHADAVVARALAES